MNIYNIITSCTDSSCSYGSYPCNSDSECAGNLKCQDFKEHGTSQTCNLNLYERYDTKNFENWVKVRHVPASEGKWHPATDNLAGSDVYGTESSSINAAAWSIKFDDIKFDYFLFATGNKFRWMIMSKDQVNGQFYNDELRSIISAS